MLCIPLVILQILSVPIDFFTTPAAACSWLLLSSSENSDLLAPACFLMVMPGGDLGIVLLSWHLTGVDAQSESVSSPDTQWV